MSVLSGSTAQEQSLHSFPGQTQLGMSPILIVRAWGGSGQHPRQREGLPAARRLSPQPALSLRHFVPIYGQPVRPHLSGQWLSGAAPWGHLSLRISRWCSPRRLDSSIGPKSRWFLVRSAFSHVRMRVMTSKLLASQSWNPINTFPTPLFLLLRDWELRTVVGFLSFRSHPSVHCPVTADCTRPSLQTLQCLLH